MNKQHTPGPWIGPDQNGKFNSNHAWSAVDDSASCSESAPVWADGKVIALVVYSSSNRFSLKGNPSVTANARLIAAAPDLLEALKTIVAAHAVPSSVCAERPAYEAARAAITKATGGEA